jgi:alpha-L-arabinofuranosidase
MKPNPTLTIGPIVLVAALLASNLAAEPARITVDIARPGHPIAPTLWGVFFEDINLSADGGIYPEGVRNRSFEDAMEPEHWRLTNLEGDANEMSIDTSRPLNPFNRRSLKLRVNGKLSLTNEGYWGIHLVQGERYVVRLAARAGDGFTGSMVVGLESKGAGSARSQLTGFADAWKDFEIELTATGTDPKGALRLVIEGQGSLWLDMVSVLPKRTWRGHGLRPDLCEMLAALKPSFFRFPGGCWVEGDDTAHNYRWKNTIGDVRHRIPLWNIWQYWGTHGLGYHEYLQLSEDLSAEPLFCINVGMSHREVVPLDQMGPWVQDALDAIEYANGSTNTVWGSLRGRNGHPTPFHLKYLEIGNENGGPAYHERWALFHDAIKARHPEIQLIANVWGSYPTNRPPEIVDEHYYNNPEFFMREAKRYDTYRRDGPKVFVGEYAVTSGAGLGNLRGAIGEAAFMTGLERNSDVVIMAAYAPLFVNSNHKRWPINLINFDSSRAFGLPSYYVQKLFSEHRGDVVLPVVVESPVAETNPGGGAVGVGTWQTQAEFKDLTVTRNGETLLAADFPARTAGWRLHGNGKWTTENGTLRQDGLDENIRAIIGDATWTDYTLSLKARKHGGREGFLILFRVKNDAEKSWWNLGGWGNQRHALELGGIVGNEVHGSIETDRWYDIRIEMKGRGIKCYLDDQLVHDVVAPTMTSLYASASRVQPDGEVIVKVVNAATEPLTTEIQLTGVNQVMSPGEAILLTHDNPAAENSLDHPFNVVPQHESVAIDGPRFQRAFPGNSLTILRLKVQ